MRTPVTEAMVVAWLAVAACGDRGPTVHRVEIRAMQFVPAELTVDVGDVIEWSNADLFPHTATADGAFDSASIASRATWRLTATTPGTFAYVCTFHPTMRGRIIVR